MDFIFEFILEFIFELIFEGSKEVIKDKKISKWIRYPIAVIFILFFMFIIFGLLGLGLFIIQENIFLGILVIVIDIVMIVGLTIKFKKVYINKK